MAVVRRSSRSHLSDIQSRLANVARNLWWTWNGPARRLFAGLDPLVWEATRRNPVDTIQRLSAERIAALRGDDGFLGELWACERSLSRYLATKTWFARSARGAARNLRVAYFCSEYAVDDSLPLYAGGLGVLAGDHLKSASDLGIPLVAVGLLYRCGYYQQQILTGGSTRVVFPQYDFERLPLTNARMRVLVPVGKKKVWVKVWRADVGRVPLYLLDSDDPQNAPADRRITEALYIGSDEIRIQQQVLLGVGGVMALAGLNIAPTVYHLNEGHAAFGQLERLAILRRKGWSTEKAVKAVRAATVFTNHTPVPAGNQRFDNALVMKYLGAFGDWLGLEREAFLDLGRETPGDRKERFCMTVLALRMSDHNNGVAALHGKVSREMWVKVYNTTRPADVPIGHVTNGIHVQTWLAPEIEPLYQRYLKPKWEGAGPDDDWWARADRIPAAELWAARNLLRARLAQYIRVRLREQILRRFGPLDDLIAAARVFDDHALTIGFARRFATYKRAALIFRDAKRLARIVGDPQRPVQIVFAGKAHPADKGGQELAQIIYRQAASAGLRGRVVLLENYDMQMGQMLTSGCDVWLNNPVRPQEASGTSGMKPPLHGGINCSILDGWWPEGFDGRNGFAIGDGRELRSQAEQDRYDADCIYELLEKQIVPLFYDRNRAGLPVGWLRVAQRSLKTIAGVFNTHRMLAEYLQHYYLAAHRRVR
jgi:starch phosphorylase